MRAVVRAIDDKPRLKQALLGFAVATGLAGAGWTSEALAPNLQLSGTVSIDQAQVSFLVSGNHGGGMLHYRGKDYPFSIGGIGLSGAGAAKLVASGHVYNLADPSKFPGAYGTVRVEHAADQGSGKLWLRNDYGVVIELTGKSGRIGLSKGDVVRISY